MFINYSPASGLSINTYRNADGYANADVIGLIEDIAGNIPGSCPVEGSKAALEDGAALAPLQSLDMPEWQWQEIVENVHALLTEA